MQLRPSARLLASAGALALAASLSSCGFDYATDRIYTQAAGVNDRDAQVDVLNAVVVSGQEGSGTFIASFANNNQLEAATVESLAGGGDDSALKVKGFSPIEIDPGQLVNLANDGGIVVKGDLGPGSVVTVTVAFDNGESVELDVPVYAPCNEFEGLDTTAPAGETYPCQVEESTGAEH